MSDVDPEVYEPNTAPCPSCGVEQEYFIGKAYGWTKCPGCGKKLHTKDVPANLIREDETKPKKDDTAPATPIIKKPPPPSGEAPKIPIRKVNTSDNLNQSDGYDDEVFNRPKPEWEILDDILTQFKVADKARSLIVARAKRTTLAPEEVQRMLGDLKTGLQKTEITYVAEEYYYAVEAEREKQQQDRGIRRGFTPVGSTDYAGFRTRTPRSEQLDETSPAWEREKHGRDPDVLTRADFERMWEDRIEKQKQEEKINDLQQTIQNMNSNITALQNQLQQNQNITPKDDKAWDIMMMMMKEKEHSTAAQSSIYGQMLSDRDKMYEKLIDTVKSAGQKPIINSDGYKSDEMRMVADGMNALSGVIKDNKPVQTLSKGMQANQKLAEIQPMEENPIKRKKKSETGILDEVPKDMIIEDE